VATAAAADDDDDDVDVDGTTARAVLLPMQSLRHCVHILRPMQLLLVRCTHQQQHLLLLLALQLLQSDDRSDDSAPHSIAASSLYIPATASDPIAGTAAQLHCHTVAHFIRCAAT
jgi:hypothetical protein